jgi:hypothetical protein
MDGRGLISGRDTDYFIRQYVRTSSEAHLVS